MLSRKPNQLEPVLIDCLIQDFQLTPRCVREGVVAEVRRRVVGMVERDLERLSDAVMLQDSSNLAI